MTIDQLAMYAAQRSRNTLNRPSLPDWIDEGFPFPPHLKQEELTKEYQKAYSTHLEWNEIVASAAIAKLDNPANEQKIAELNRCQEQAAQIQKDLCFAEKRLRQFINQEPPERIRLIEAEIAQLEISLMECLATEQEYTEAMLNDPNAARARLQRILDGYSGTKAEFSPEQLLELRRRRNAVEEIESKILSHQSDIEKIQRLVSEQERKEQAQLSIKPALTRFNECCSILLTSMQELDAIAAEYGIRVVKPNLHVPISATWQGENIIRIEIKN